MILFKEDMYKQPCIIDYNTKNKSFLKMALTLKMLGIENNKFHLVLTQPELVGVDPHDKSLTTEMMLRVAYECKINPWYYFREVVRIPISGSNPIMFELHRANMAMIWIFYNRYDLIQILPRQTYKTMSTQAIMAHVIFLDGYNITAALLTKDNKLRAENVVRLKDVRDALPQYLVNTSKNDSDNKEGLSYTRLSNRYQTFVAQGDPSAADNLGRGMTTPLQHYDEPSAFRNIHITYPIALSTTNVAAENARKHNQPCTNILTSNAGRLDTKEGKFCHNLITKSCFFTEKLYDCKNKEELEEIVMHASSNRMIYTCYSYLQLGKTHEWFKSIVSRINASQDQIDRDYLNIWKVGTAKSILPQELLLKIKASQKEPLHTEIKDGYIWRWYVDKHFLETGEYKTIPMILGMDSSENIGRDFTSLVLIDARDMSLVGTCRCNESNIIKMGIFIAKFLVLHKNTIFIPERNSTGTSIIDTVLIEFEKYGINPFKRIYNKVIQFRDEEPYKSISISTTVLDGKIRSYFGFRTTSSEDSRKYLYNTVFTKALELNCDKVFDSILIDEVCGLVIKNGRIDHASSGHDDTVIAYLLACYVLFAGKHLDYYNIEHTKLLSHFTQNQTKEDVIIEEQKVLRTQVDAIKRKINDTSSELIRVNLLRRLKVLESSIDPDVDITPTEATISRDKYDQDKVKVKGQNTSIKDTLEMFGQV